MNIDLDRLLDVAQKGVRRVAAFLALGVNSARDPNMRNYLLPTDIPLQLLPDRMSDKWVDALKTEFEKWVILSGLRELIETFAVYLDGVYKVGLAISVNKEDMKPEEAMTFERAFERKGIEDKLEKLKNRFGIGTSKDKYIVSVSKARNCLAHRRGVVGAPDTDEAGVLRVTWWATDLFIETPDGKEVSVPVPEGGVLLDKGGQLKIRFTDREREFHPGQVLELTARDLAEICNLVGLAAHEVMAAAIEFARSHGIQINERPRP